MDIKESLDELEKERAEFIEKRVGAIRKTTLVLITMSVLLSTVPFFSDILVEKITAQGVLLWGVGMTVSLVATMTATVIYTRKYNKALLEFFAEHEEEYEEKNSS